MNSKTVPNVREDNPGIVHEKALREILSPLLHLGGTLEPVADFKEKLKRIVAVSPNRITFDAGVEKGYVTVQYASRDEKLIVANLHAFENLRSVVLEKPGYSLFMESWPKSLESVCITGEADLTPLACGKFTNLKSITVLEGVSPIDLNSLAPVASQIQSLCFKECTDEGALSGFTNLETLACGDLSTVKHLHNLKLLFIEHYTGQTLDGLDAPELRGIRIQSSTLQNIDGIRNCLNLEAARFISCREGIRSIEPLSGLENLKELVLSSPAVKDFSPLSKLSNLEILNLYGTFIENLEVLRGLSCLTELHMENVLHTDKKFYKPLSDLKNLQKLWIPLQDEWMLPESLEIDRLNGNKFEKDPICFNL